MTRKWISKFQKIFPDKQIIADEKGNIIVKNIDNSFVYINPLDVDDLQKLRKELHDDRLSLFDGLISELQYLKRAIPKHIIKHLYTIDELKRSSRDNNILFENDLAFFTEKEIENHLKLIEYLKRYQVALLSGGPATGKSISVVDIANRLEERGFVTYYYSFKRQDRWAEIWEEILLNKDIGIVFVLDDVHLEPRHATEALLKIASFDDLNILFVSREVEEVIDIEQQNIYEELNNFTIKTEQPNLDDKAIGIINKFQSYFQHIHKGKYLVNNHSVIIDKSYRNLVVLREYLKYWESLPDIPLSELDETDFYKSIYRRYFTAQDIKHSWETPFLQYLCLYYFEINFYPNPKYFEETDALAENANRIVSDGRGRYSIYHSEYAFLLLKAYKAVNYSRFSRKYRNWEDFFYRQITDYLYGFIEEFDNPENLFEILSSIPRFKKDIKSAMENSSLIFASIIEAPNVREWLLECCSKENEVNQFHFLFLSSIILHKPKLIKLFLSAFETNQLVVKSEWAFSLYASIFHYFSQYSPKDLIWLDEYFLSYMPTIFKDSKLTHLSTSLSNITRTDETKGQILYSAMSDDLLLLKLESAHISQIGQALSSLNKVDSAKTKALYAGIPDDDLKASLATAHISQIGDALRNLNNLDPAKTKALYAEISVNDLKASLATARITEIGDALRNLNNLDPAKTKALYAEISVNDLKASLATARITEIGDALRNLNKVDPEKTKALYEGNDAIIAYLEASRINKISKALNSLSDVDPEEAKALYAEIPDDDLKVFLATARINEIGQALNSLNKVDPEEAKALYAEIPDDDLIASCTTARINEIGYALSNLNKVDSEKTKALYAEIPDDDLIASCTTARITEIGDALSNLNNLDPAKTKALYAEISVNDLKASLATARITEIGDALSNLNKVDSEKTKALYAEIPDDALKASLATARINEIGLGLNLLMKLEIEKTALLYKTIGNTLIIEKVTEASITYSGLLVSLTVFPKLAPQLAKELFNKLPESVLFNWVELDDNLNSFNILLSILTRIGYTNEKQFKQLVDFGWQRRDSFLDNHRLQTIGSYISLMSEHENRWVTLLEKHFDNFKYRVLKKDQKNYVAGFIATIYQHCPHEAINIFEAFQKKYPEEQNVFAYTYYYIGKKLLEKDKSIEAKQFFLKAKSIFEEIEMENVCDEINEIIREIKFE